QFQKALDESIQSLNSDYEAKRYKNMALLLPTIHIVPEGTFYKWLKLKGKLGGQHKVPRLSNNREYLTEILEHCL
ncbi:MAG: GH3 auxin-responsive promoter family protein, partial [Cytophagales bacterium]|nr:GH3 auxin-responsive promoter family protein [Cytophaga sp.]